MNKLLLMIFIVSNSVVFGQNLTTSYTPKKEVLTINTYDGHKKIVNEKGKSVKFFAYLNKIVKSISHKEIEKMKQAKQFVIKRSNNF